MCRREAGAHDVVMDYTIKEAAVLPGSPVEVFDLITDLERLPDWNVELREVLDVPVRLEVGAEWLIRIHAMRTHWNSRARIVQFDREGGVFAYRSQSDDGNPTHADWRWELTPGEHGRTTRVDVQVTVRPRTFWRKHLLLPLRRRGLRHAIQQSLGRLRGLSTVS